MRRHHLLAAVALLGSLTPSCWVTSGEFDSHRTRLEARLHALETNDQQRRRQLQEAVEQATAQVQTLNQQLEQARTQTRNLADLASRFEAVDERLRTLAGALEELRHAVEEASTARTQTSARVDAIERRVGIAPPVDPAQLPSEPAQLLTMARQAFDARDYTRARYVAQTLVRNSAQHELADDAVLLVARSHIAENRSATGVQELQRLLQTYPQGDAVPEALTALAEAFVNLRMCTEAQRTLRLLIERHGRTPAGAAARARLDAVRRLPREACSG